jgi:hypothetical protein
MAKEKCLNCGCGIGDLEMPYIWNERVVCRSCHAKLQPKSGMSKAAVLTGGFAVVIAVVVGGAVWLAKSKPVATAIPVPAIQPVAVPVPLPKVTAPQPPATPALTNITLLGSAWLVRGDASSNLLRGLHIYIIPSTIDAKVYRECLESIAAYNEGVGGIQAAGATDGTLPESSAAEGKDLEAKATVIRALAAKVTQPVSVEVAYRTMCDSHGTGRSWFNPAAIPGAVAACTTNADGKYSISASVMPGRYYLFASIETPGGALYVEWLVPLDVVQDKSFAIDLDNDNAAQIDN